KVRLARWFVLEGVEDPEGRVVDLEAVPDARARFLFHDRLTALDEGLDLSFLAGLRLDQGQDSKGQCHKSPATVDPVDRDIPIRPPPPPGTQIRILDYPRRCPEQGGRDARPRVRGTRLASSTRSPSRPGR